MWTLHHNFRDFIIIPLNNSVIGLLKYVLSKKLQNLKSGLKQWNKNIVGNIHDKVNDSLIKLEGI